MSIPTIIAYTIPSKLNLAFPGINNNNPEKIIPAMEKIKIRETELMLGIFL